MLITLSGFNQVRITGKVTDTKNVAIPGASITVKDSYDGATTDSTGKFSFRTAEKGEQTIVVSSIGYNNSELKITIGTETININFSLKEKLDELKAVMVTAGTFEAGDKKELQLF